MIDPKKIKLLGCSATCALALSDMRVEMPCTPHDRGLCVALMRVDSNKKGPILGLRVTHVASGFAFDPSTSYPATKPGLAAALHELGLLLPLADWTASADDFMHCAVAANAIVKRCRSAFPGKLIGDVVTRDVAEPPAEIVKWRVYSQDTATGEWSFVDLAHEDHLLGAVDEALTMFDGPNKGQRRDTPVDGAPLDFDSRGVAFDFNHALHVFTLGHEVERWRTVAVQPDPLAFDLVCTQRAEMLATLAQAERELRGANNPRRTLGVWKSGPKFGQLKLAAGLPPEQCVEILARQDKYDAQARKVEALRADLQHLEMLLVESEPIPERVTKLCPRETPDGKDEAVKLLAFLREQPDSSRRSLVFDKCCKKLEANLREYESVETHGFAPGSRCIFVGDLRDGETDCEVEIEDVIVSRAERWSAEPGWWHERDVIDVNTGARLCVTVSRLRAKETA